MRTAYSTIRLKTKIRMNNSEGKDMVEIKYLELAEADRLGFDQWMKFERQGPAEIDWIAEAQEVAYILEGSTTLIIGDVMIDLIPGNLVVFPAQTRCKWVTPKHYKKAYINNYRI